MSIYISNSLFLSSTFGSGDFNPNNPIIGYHSVLTPDDISAPVSASIRPAINAWSPDTSLVWEGEPYTGASATITQFLVLDNTTTASVDYVGIARHNFGSEGYTYTIQSSDDGGTTWIDRSTPKIVSGDDAIIEFFDARVSALFRIKIEKTATEVAAPIIGHVKLGQALVLQRRIYAGHQPAALAKSVKKTTYGSESGQYLGQVVHRSYRKTSLQQENNSPDFVREKIVPFINHVNGHNVVDNTAPATFFFSWRPSDYPDEVIYGWTPDNIMPENQGGDSMGGRMSWSMDIEAIA